MGGRQGRGGAASREPRSLTQAKARRRNLKRESEPCADYRSAQLRERVNRIVGLAHYGQGM